MIYDINFRFLYLFFECLLGAFTTFKPNSGFTLKKVEDALQKYSDIFTHVSKIDDEVIQLIFAEKEYSGDSVVYAEEFFDELKKSKLFFGPITRTVFFRFYQLGYQTSAFIGNMIYCTVHFLLANIGISFGFCSHAALNLQ